MSAPSQMPLKLFVQMSGAPGSGKSTVARLLRPLIGGVVIDHDVLRSSILEAGVIRFDQAAKQAYHLQWALAHDLLKQGFSIIIDSTCNYPEVVARGSMLASRYGYTYWYIECKVQDIDLLDQRLRARAPMISQRTAVNRPPTAAQSTRVNEDSYALFMQWIESPCRPDDNIIVVDATRNVEMIRDQILDQIIGQSK